jgi:rhamnosyltransferase subunit B
MARIVISTFGSFGDVNPYIGLGLELQRRGHHPVLAMPGIFREPVAREGLPFAAIRPDLDPDDAALTARIMDPARGSETLFTELLVPQLQASYEDLAAAAERADLIVTHPASMVGPILAQQRSLPWVSSVLAPLSFFSVSDPMVPPPAPWLYPLLARSRAVSRAFGWVSDRLTRRWVAPVQRFRASLGLPAGANPVLAGQHSPQLVLALFSRVLAEPQPDWPGQTVVAGPILFNGAATPAGSAELERFLADGEPPIVFTLGTSAVEAAGSFYEVSAEAARRLSRRAVLLVGRHARNRPRATGADLLAVDYAPHAVLFPRSAAIVHQGGAGTLHQALIAGRPTLVVPHAHDQPDNARRVERLGISRTVYPRRYTVAAVERALGELLVDPHCAARARQVGAVVAAERGASRAADAIEAVLR